MIKRFVIILVVVCCQYDVIVANAETIASMC